MIARGDMARGVEYRRNELQPCASCGTAVDAAMALYSQSGEIICDACGLAECNRSREAERAARAKRRKVLKAGRLLMIAGALLFGMVFAVVLLGLWLLGRTT